MLSKVEAHIDYLRKQLLQDTKRGQDLDLRSALGPCFTRSLEEMDDGLERRAGITAGGGFPRRGRNVANTLAAVYLDEISTPHGARRSLPADLVRRNHYNTPLGCSARGEGLTEAEELRLHGLLRKLSSPPGAAAIPTSMSTPTSNLRATSAATPASERPTPPFPRRQTAAESGQYASPVELSSPATYTPRIIGDGVENETRRHICMRPACDEQVDTGDDVGSDPCSGRSKPDRKRDDDLGVVRTDSVIRELFGRRDEALPAAEGRSAGTSPGDQMNHGTTLSPAMETAGLIAKTRTTIIEEPGITSQQCIAVQGVTKSPSATRAMAVAREDLTVADRRPLGGRDKDDDEEDDLDDISDGGFHTGCWRRKYAQGEMR